MRNLSLTAAAAALPLLSLLAAAPQANDHTPFDAILKDVIKSGKVDYALLRDKHAAELDAYLASFHDYSNDANPRLPLEDYINLYNATMLKAVLEHRAKDSNWKPSDNNFAVFKEPRVALRTGVTTLDFLENQIIRKFGDPRIHAALNCAALSCPPLAPAAFTHDNLNDLLDANMKAFVNDPTRNTFNDANKTANLSSIFNWFAPDFGGPEKLPAFLAKYRPGDYASYKLTYADYDWHLNEVK
jgi:hypothetical protein